MGNHGYMACRDFGRRCTHALRERTLGVGWDGRQPRPRSKLELVPPLTILTAFCAAQSTCALYFHPADKRSCRGCDGRFGVLTAQGRRQSLQVEDGHRECGVTVSPQRRGHLVREVDTDACVMVGPETQTVVSH